MSVKVTRKKGESFDAMARRFRLHVTRRGLIQEVRDKRFSHPVKSRNMKRKSALARVKLGQKYAYLRKVGQLPVLELGKRSRRSF